MVGERGFEPPTPWSRTRCSTRLSHSPTMEAAGRRKSTRGAYFLVGRKIIAPQVALRISVPCLALISRYTEPTSENGHRNRSRHRVPPVDSTKYDRPSRQSFVYPPRAD